MSDIFIDDFENYLSNFINEIESNGAELVDAVIIKGNFSALALVRSRIQQKGENADGQKFKAYSQKSGYFSLSSARTKAVKGKGKDPKSNRFFYIKGEKVRERKTRYEKTGYLGWRGSNDLQTAITDLTFRSGNGKGIWDNILMALSSSSNTHTVFIQAKPSHRAQLLSLNSRYGNILRLSDNELSLLKELLIDEVRIKLNL